MAKAKSKASPAARPQTRRKPVVAKARPAARANRANPRGTSAGRGSKPGATLPSPARATVKAARVAVRVPGGPASAYEVRIGDGLLGTAAEGLAARGGAALVVVDSRLPRAGAEQVLAGLERAGIRWGVCVVGASEADKSLGTAERVLVECGRLRLGRDGLVIALGGGVVGDVAGFAGAVFARGVRVVQCPTTLLAMVDAAVGGKTGVNLLVPEAAQGESDASKPVLVKNLVGAFHQPARVVCDVGTLRSLPRREFRAGLGECLKHGLIGGSAGDAGLLAWTERQLDRVLAMEPAALVELVRRNVALKASVVARDPREDRPGSEKGDGGRMMLNLGHTFAHAIETLPGLSWTGPEGTRVVGPLRHGEAVGLGLLAAARLGVSLRLAEKDLPGLVEALLKRAGLPTRVEGLPATARVVERMAADKKMTGGRMRLVVPARGRRVRIAVNPASEAVFSAIDALRG